MHFIFRHQRLLLLGRKALTNLESIITKQRHHFAAKVCLGKSVVYPVVIQGCVSWNFIEGWAPKNQCFWIVVLGKTLEIPLDSQEIKPVNPKGNQPWVFTGRTDAVAEALILWPPDTKSWLIGKRACCWERLRAREGDDRRWNGWMASMDMSLSKLWEMVRDRKVCHAAVHGVAKSWTRLSDWARTIFRQLTWHVFFPPQKPFLHSAGKERVRQTETVALKHMHYHL